jgi:hypothetical protein
MARGIDRIVMTVDRLLRTSRANLLMPAVASCAAFVVVIVFFAPRFIFWPWIDLDPEEHHPPEFNRAIDTLRQLNEPFRPITNPSNRVIKWRLLFPIVGHYLHLPPRAFLALPAVGCLLVLGYMAHLIRRESGGWWAPFAASALVGTTSWFFVSTGWLAYFDSWYMLGLLVAAFGRSKVAAGLACLLTPWVDERFVLTLPLVVVVRCIASRRIEGEPSGRFLSEGVRAFALVAPCCAMRLVAVAIAHDEGSTGLIRTQLTVMPSASQIADGLWSGLRGLWLFVALAPALLISNGRMVWAGLLLLAAAMTIAANLTVANDLSRSASTVVPGAVLGIVLLVRARPSLAGWALAMTLAFNLLTPAWHVIRGWDESSRIYPLHTELERLNRPPALMAGLHIIRASRFARRGQLARALAEVDIAIKINPTSIAGLLNRSFLLDNLGRLGEAAACLDAAVRLAPGLPETHRQRGRFHRDHGQLTAAAHDFRSAIDLTPAGSRDRAALERELAGVRRALDKL